MSNAAKADDEDERTWKDYVAHMFPAKSLEGANLELLKDELEACFLMDPDDREAFENGECDPMSTDTGENLFKFAQKVGGLQWLNAVHELEDRPGVESQYTPLTYVLEKDPQEWRTVQLLLQVGADPNLRDARGRPPLFYAIWGEGMGGPRWRVVFLLLEAGANPLAVYRGKSLAELAKDLAKDNDQEEVRSMIWDTIKQKLRLPDDDDDDDDDMDSSDEEAF